MKYLLQNRHWQLLLVIFLSHQLWEKGLSIHSRLIDNYLDDLLCMPILLGGLLAEQMDLVKRRRLSWWQVLICTILVSWIFEMLLPGLNNKYTADVWDIGCYIFGALYFFVFLNPRKTVAYA